MPKSHSLTLIETEFYLFWQGHKTAVLWEGFDETINQWDQLVLSCDTPKWKNLPMYFKISYVETGIQHHMLLHLKK